MKKAAVLAAVFDNIKTIVRLSPESPSLIRMHMSLGLNTRALRLRLPESTEYYLAFNIFAFPVWPDSSLNADSRSVNV